MYVYYITIYTQQHIENKISMTKYFTLEVPGITKTQLNNSK